MNFNYVRLLVSDVPRSVRFYHDVLGLPVRMGAEKDAIYAEFDTGATTLALFQRDLMAQVAGTHDLPAAATAQDNVTVIFDVEGVDDEYERLRGRGITFVTAPQDRPDWGIRTAHFRDPDGNLIEINQSL